MPAVRYVVLEGIDGAGKSELAGALSADLRTRGHLVEERREPSDAFLRREALRLARTDPIAAALAFTVDRSLARPELERALSAGRIVLQDRSYFSTLAYQGHGLPDASKDALRRIQEHVARRPDLVLYLDLPVAEALRRVGRRGASESTEEAGFLEVVRAEFERLFEPGLWVRIDATGDRGATLRRAADALAAVGL